MHTNRRSWLVMVYRWPAAGDGRRWKFKVAPTVKLKYLERIFRFSGTNDLSAGTCREPQGRTRVPDPLPLQG